MGPNGLPAPMPFTKTNKLVRSVADTFTPERRQKIQMFLTTLAPILVGLGLATTAETEQWLIISALTIQAIAGLLNLVNLRGALNIWTALRGIVYTLATGVAPALTWLGYVDQDTSAILLNGLSLGLSSLSALIAIFVSKDQQAEKEIAELEVYVHHETGVPRIVTRAEYRQLRQARADDLDALRQGEA